MDNLMRRLAIFAIASGVGIGTALAHQQGPKLHLADAPPQQQVEAITYCKGTYRVFTIEGPRRDYPEFDLRFKSDSSENGPTKGNPAIIPGGMRGDRVFVIFSTPDEISPFIRSKCD